VRVRLRVRLGVGVKVRLRVGRRLREAPVGVLLEREEGEALPRLGDLDDRCDELAHEVMVLEQRRPVAVDEVDDQPLDVRAVVVLVGHDHQVPVAQRLVRGRVRVVLALLQPEDLLELGDLLVGHDRRVVGVAHVEQLAAQREDAVVVAADDRQAGDGEGLGRVALGNDERALVAVLAARLVGVVELGDAREPLVRVRVGVRVGVRVRVGGRIGVRIEPTCFLAPSVFLSSLLCLF